MSLYEVPGDFVPKDEEINPNFTCYPSWKRSVLGQMLGQGISLDVIDTISSYLNKGVGHSSFMLTHNAYKVDLPAGFVIDNINSIFPIIDALNVSGWVELQDIKVFRYSVLALNDDRPNVTSLKRDGVNEFNRTFGLSRSLYSLELKYTDMDDKVCKFSIIIELGKTKINDLMASQQSESLKDYWFPKIDKYFRDAVPNTKTAVDRFVQECRDRIKERA